MKTISGKSISTKPISLSKAAKILSKFVSAENGASQAISAYLHRASASFNELNQLHKGLKSSSSEQKHKMHRSETHDDREKIMETSIRDVEINQEANRGAVQSKNKFRRHQFGSENTDKDEEKPSQTVVKFSQEPNDAIEYHAGNEGGGEKYKKKKNKKHGVEIGERKGEDELLTKAVNEDEEKPIQNVVDFSQEPNDAIANHAGNVVEKEKHKKKKKKQEDESRKHGVDRVEFGERGNEGKLPTNAQESLAWSVDSCQELGDAGEDNKGMDEGKKHKRDKKKKKDKDGSSNVSGNKDMVGKPEGESAMGTEDQKEREKIRSNSLEGENGGLVDQQELHSKKKKRDKAASEENINTEEVKREKKRKNEDVEERVEERSGEPHKKRTKRKHGGDD